MPCERTPALQTGAERTLCREPCSGSRAQAHRIEDAGDGPSDGVCAVPVDGHKCQRPTARPLWHLIRGPPNSIAVPAPNTHRDTKLN